MLTGSYSGAEVAMEARHFPESSGFGKVGPVFSPWSNQSLEESPLASFWNGVQKPLHQGVSVITKLTVS
jgi:hypothetical protein